MTRQNRRKHDVLHTRAEVGKRERQYRAAMKRAIRNPRATFAEARAAAVEVVRYGAMAAQIDNPRAVSHVFAR